MDKLIPVDFACSKTGMYYGGDPPAWTVTPSIPAEGLYKNLKAKVETPAPAKGNLVQLIKYHAWKKAVF